MLRPYPNEFYSPCIRVGHQHPLIRSDPAPPMTRCARFLEVALKIALKIALELALENIARR